MLLHHADMLMYVKKKIPFFVATYFEPILLMALNNAELLTPPPIVVPYIPLVPLKSPTPPTQTTPASPVYQQASPLPKSEPQTQKSTISPRQKPTISPRQQPRIPLTTNSSDSSISSQDSTPTSSSNLPSISETKNNFINTRNIERHSSTMKPPPPKESPRRYVSREVDTSSLLDVPSPGTESSGRRIRLVDLTSKSLVTESTRLAHCIHSETRQKQEQELPSWW